MALYFPLEIIRWLQSYENAFWDFFFDSISLLGEEYFYIAVLGALYWVVNKRMGEFLGVTLGASLTFNNLVKNILSQPRPFEDYPDDVINKRPDTATGHAMPSGHVQGSSSLFFAIAFYLKQRVWLIVAIVVTVLMMFSRMYLGVHYIQDVIVGAIVAILIAFVMHYFYQKYAGDQNRLHKFYLMILLVFLPFYFLFASDAAANDFFRGYGILVGIIVGVMVEKKYVNFTLDIPLLKKLVRYFLGLIIMGLVLIGVGLIFDLMVTSALVKNILDFIRYFLVAFVGLGLYPYIFKRFSF